MSKARELPASVGFIDLSGGMYDTEKPFFSTVPFTKTKDAQATMSNVKSVYKTVLLNNIRGREKQFTLDINGFEIVQKQTTYSAWEDGPSVVSKHYPEMESLLKKHLKADKVVIYDHTIRRGVTSHANPELDQPSKEDNIAIPSTRVHIDSTLAAAIQAIKQDCGPTASQLLKGRFQVINIWRPLSEPVLQNPLILCDSRTVAPELCIPTDLVYPHRATEILMVGHDAAQKWYYLDKQRCDECWLIKIVDSKAGKDRQIAPFTPHTSVKLQEVDQDVPRRESVEFRAYVFYQDD